MSVLNLHNTLTGRKVPFEPVDRNHVRVYACGPTVYNYAHIGNARMAVVFDLLNRVLRAHYPNVTYVSNITDVDDKIMTAAKDTGQSATDLTEKYTRIYNEDMAALGVLPPDVQPRATAHIPEMIALIESLIRRDHAYVARPGHGDGQAHVLFNVPSFPAYGRLSNRSRDDQIAGARIEVAPFKRDPADFVLWKPSAPDQMGWDSPWGFGRPGWHIECSAMAEKHLGLPFDIHGGGADLKFPHHENELAQSCCAHGQENDPYAFSRYWIHNGFVIVEGEKMSKSLGNVTLVHDLLKDWRGEVLRLALLSAHYRAPLDWTKTLLTQSQAILDGMYRTLHSLSDVQAETQNVAEAVTNMLEDDLNSAGAMTALQALCREAASNDNKAIVKGKILAAGNILGILQYAPAVWLGYENHESDDTGAIEALIVARQEARKAKDFKRSDAIRHELAEKGIEIEDSPAGVKWRRVSI